MRTVRSSGRLSRGVCSGGCLLGGVSAPGGSALGGGVSAPGGVCSRGKCLLLRGVCFQGSVCSQGGCLLPGVWYPSMHWDRHPSRGQTHACKNITFATSLLTVISFPLIVPVEFFLAGCLPANFFLVNWFVNLFGVSEKWVGILKFYNLGYFCWQLRFFFTLCTILDQEKTRHETVPFKLMIIQYYIHLILICARGRLLCNCFHIVVFKDLFTLATVKVLGLIHTEILSDSGFVVHSHCLTPRPIQIKCVQNLMETCIDLCLWAAWPPPYNSIQAIFIAVCLCISVWQCKHHSLYLILNYAN